MIVVLTSKAATINEGLVLFGADDNTPLAENAATGHSTRSFGSIMRCYRAGPAASQFAPELLPAPRVEAQLAASRLVHTTANTATISPSAPARGFALSAADTLLNLDAGVTA